MSTDLGHKAFAELLSLKQEIDQLLKSMLQFDEQLDDSLLPDNSLELLEIDEWLDKYLPEEKMQIQTEIKSQNYRIHEGIEERNPALPSPAESGYCSSPAPSPASPVYRSGGDQAYVPQYKLTSSYIAPQSHTGQKVKIIYNRIFQNSSNRPPDY